MVTESSIDLPSTILTCVVIAALLETVAPARPSPHLLKRWVNNLSLSVITYAFNHFALTALAIYLLKPFESQPVIDFSGLPLWLSVPMCVLVYDFVAYALHVASHKVPLFWRFHSVHHADEQVDISTAFRHHPLESLISLLPLLILSVCLGLPVEALLVYRMLELAQKVFTHTNVKVPDALEGILREAQQDMGVVRQEGPVGRGHGDAPVRYYLMAGGFVTKPKA